MFGTRRFLLLFTLVASATICKGNFTTSDGEIKPVDVAAPSWSLGGVWADANALADRHAGSAVVIVSGDSMVPYFRNGDVLVMKPIAAAALQPGMVVVYRNRFHETVAHRVTAPTEGGWTVKGYANERTDTTVVSAENLLGVVYAVFHPRDSHGATVAGLDTGSHRPPTVALAAPAR